MIINFQPDKIRSEKSECLMSQGANGNKQEVKLQLNERGELPIATPAANKKVEISMTDQNCWEVKSGDG
ncbi:hypothetical protein L6494_30145 (plasmid) [Nostoc sp. UHCC 0870]|uniref:hypothetical protein n=2 Tax=Nostoc sp. UHCC 0870 TaxID=2914041 RepID=UPI001EE14165|nr:hypothetical protein [Nostoc sp. UHCC 0870]UKP01496.1 hypothetical protein L6494_30145 [Nostoc sp. UHCC 0870]